MKRCFCKPGLMHQCTAPTWAEQITCGFYMKHSYYERCSHKCEMYNNHCDSHEAQDNGYSPDGEITTTTRTGRVHQAVVVDEDVRSCNDCIAYTCDHLESENAMAAPRGGLTYEDLINIARQCRHFIHEDQYNRVGKL